MEFPSKLRSYSWGRRRSGGFAEGSRVKPEGYQLATSKIRLLLRENAV